MYDPYKRRIQKITALAIAGILLASAFSGCKKDENPANETSSAPNVTETASPVNTTAPKEEGIWGTVTAEELNVREGVGIDYEVVTKLKKDDRVEIFEQQDLNGIMWGRIENGWICLTYVHIDGEPMEEVPEETVYQISDSITGTVIATELNIRKGPSTNYDVAGKLLKGDEITVTELNGNWGKTEKGWVNTIFVYFQGTMDAETVKAVVTADKLNVRSGPSTTYESLKKLEEGSEVEIIKQVTIRGTLWGYIGDGWVCMDYVKIDSE